MSRREDYLRQIELNALEEIECKILARKLESSQERLRTGKLRADQLRETVVAEASR